MAVGHRLPFCNALTTAIAPCIWGTTYLVTTEYLPPDRPLTAAVLRVLPIGLIMLVTLRTAPKGDWWWRIAILGLLNIGIFQALLFISAYRLPGGVAATVIAMQPLGVVILSRPLLDVRPSLLAWVAACTGVVGVALLVLTPAARLDATGIVAALAGAVCIAMGTVLTKRWNPPLSTAAFTAWQLLFGGIFLLPLAMGLEAPPGALTVRNLSGYAYLAIVGTGITYIIWFRGLRKLPASAVSILGLLSPIVATLIGYVVLDQTLSPMQMAGGALVLWSVWAGQNSR